MPWKETCVMNERVKLLTEYLEGEYGITELSQTYEVSRKTMYKWIARYEKEGWAGLEDRSRAPHSHPNAVEEKIERKLLELKARWPLWGAPKLWVKLREAVGADRCPAESTVSEILRRHGLSGLVKRRRRAVPTEQPFEECREANAAWCTDFKGWFRTTNGRKCTPLTISDAHSRCLLCCQGLGGATGFITVKPLFIKTFRECGLPDAMRTDNGPPLASRALGGLSDLAVWWVRLGIELQRIEPGCPQQNGRHERMHRTLKEATAQPPRANLGAQQKAFEAFRREYNEERPHESLGQRPPALFYQPAAREYPCRLPEQRGYPDEWEKRRVRKAGQMKWKGEDILVSSTLRGQEIGLKPVGEAQWAVYFETLELGLFDERLGRVLPAKRLRRKPPTQDQEPPQSGQ